MQRLTSSAARCCCSVLSYQSAPTAATLKRSISFFPSSSAPIQQDDIDPLPARIKPTSTQWYTGQPTYTDALNTLQSTQHALRLLCFPARRPLVPLLTRNRTPVQPLVVPIGSLGSIGRKAVVGAVPSPLARVERLEGPVAVDEGSGRSRATVLERGLDRQP